MAFSLIAVLIAGCESKPEVPEHINVKVLAFNATAFNDSYGNFFLASHPNADLTVVSVLEQSPSGQVDLNQKILDIMKKEQPDVVELSMDFIDFLQSQD